MFKKLWRFIRNVFVYWVVMLAGVAFYVLFPAVTGWFDAPDCYAEVITTLPGGAFGVSGR